MAILVGACGQVPLARWLAGMFRGRDALQRHHQGPGRGRRLGRPCPCWRASTALSIHRSYDRSVAAVARGVVAAQFRRVEPRGLASAHAFPASVAWDTSISRPDFTS